MPTNVIMTGTGIVIPASFELSVVTDPEGKISRKGHFIDDSNEYKFIISSEKTFLKSAGVLIFSGEKGINVYTTEVIINLELQWASKVLSSKTKIRFSSVLDTFSSLPPETMLIFLFPRLHRPQPLRNME